MDHAGVGAAILALIVALVWVVKRVIPAILAQNKKMLEGGLEHMRANTEAVQAVTGTLQRFIAVRDERDVAIFKQLDRIEAHRK
jgi:hypothetical protein